VLAEDTRNALTSIIELRTSCQLVWQTIIQVENKRKSVGSNDKTKEQVSFIRMSDGRSGKFSLEEQDYTELENAVYFT